MAGKNGCWLGISDFTCSLYVAKLGFLNAQRFQATQTSYGRMDSPRASIPTDPNSAWDPQFVMVICYFFKNFIFLLFVSFPSNLFLCPGREDSALCSYLKFYNSTFAFRYNTVFLTFSLVRSQGKTFLSPLIWIYNFSNTILEKTVFFPFKLG